MSFAFKWRLSDQVPRRCRDSREQRHGVAAQVEIDSKN
jgi:hypothetical protein